MLESVNLCRASLGVVAVSLGLTLLTAPAIAQDKVERVTTQNLQVATNQLAAGNTSAANGVDCSIQSHPDCQPKPPTPSNPTPYTQIILKRGFVSD